MDRALGGRETGRVRERSFRAEREGGVTRSRDPSQTGPSCLTCQWRTRTAPPTHPLLKASMYIRTRDMFCYNKHSFSLWSKPFTGSFPQVTLINQTLPWSAYSLIRSSALMPFRRSSLAMKMNCECSHDCMLHRRYLTQKSTNWTNIYYS